MKKRSSTTPVGNAGVTAVRDYCDRHHLIFQAEPREDFGIDCYIEVEFPPYPQNFLVGMQVKSGPSHRYDRADGTFAINVSQSDIAYWLAANYPVLFVYLHEHENTLYFKHVQSVYDSALSVEDCTNLKFSLDDRAEPGVLAQYIRNLARTTPSIMSRVNVLGQDASIAIGTAHTPLQPGLAMPNNLTFDTFRFSSTEEVWKVFPRYPTVLGYSANGRWICEMRITDGGPRGGFSAEVAFVDVSTHSMVKVPLFTIDDLEIGRLGETGSRHERYCAALSHLDQVARFLNIYPAIELYQAYDLLFQPEHRLPIQLCFGNEKFSLGVGYHEGRDVLMLRCDAYAPPRSTPLLVERVKPVVAIPIIDQGTWTEEHFTSIMHPQRFEYVAGVTVNANGSKVSFAVMTTDSHSCWGTRTVHLAHFSLQELRRACSDALRV